MKHRLIITADDYGMCDSVIGQLMLVQKRE